MCAISSLTSTFAISSPDKFLLIMLCYLICVYVCMYGQLLVLNIQPCCSCSFFVYYTIISHCNFDIAGRI